MLEAMVSSPKAYSPPPKGQQQWTSPGTFQWVCPEGVTSVSFVVVGGGQSGTNSGSNNKGGSGGGLRYRNNVPVTPGQSYTVVVANIGGTSSVLGTSAGNQAYFSGPSTGGGPGGTGGTGSYTVIAPGGKGGRYDGSNPGLNYQTNTRGPNLFGVDDADSYGSGGYSVQSSGGVPSNASGKSGAVRIIWGAGRLFPSNAANV